jgi:hypothetical protein
MVAVLVVAGLQLWAYQQVTDADQDEHAAHVERVDGTEVSRVTLTEKAIERIGLKTDQVREVNVSRKWIVGGDVVVLSDKIASGSASTPVPKTPSSAPGQVEASAQALSEGADRSSVGVRVRLSAGDLEKVARGEPVRILRPGRDDDDDDDDTPGLTARQVEMRGVGDSKNSTTALYYVVDNPKHGLVPGQRVGVRLALSGKGKKRKVVPYSALIYDPDGDTWVYTSPKPRTFVRYEVEVDYIEGDMAVLDEGPPTGTVIAVVGVAELYGAEFKVGH